MSSSESYTRAGPEKRRPSLPVIFATEPSGREIALQDLDVAASS